MADDFPPHYAVSVTATSDGSGAGRVHRDSIFNMVSSANQNNQIRLPDAFIGKRVEGYVGANGVTLAASRPLNQDTTYQVPPNYYFEAVQTPEGWNVELVDNLGQGGGVWLRFGGSALRVGGMALRADSKVLVMEPLNG